MRVLRTPMRWEESTSTKMFFSLMLCYSKNCLTYYLPGARNGTNILWPNLLLTFGTTISRAWEPFLRKSK